MISPKERTSIIDLLSREVIPAIGCTEPIAVAFAVARATQLIGGVPHRITAELSANVLKNAMGVGIPSTGMTGLPIAIALGATVGRADLGLEVLRDVTPEAVEVAKEFIDEGRINISLSDEALDKLYIKVSVENESCSAVVIIATGHTNIIFESKDGAVLIDKGVKSSCEESESES